VGSVNVGALAINLFFQASLLDCQGRHIWNLYETALAPVSISYGAVGKYPPPATAERARILIRIEVSRGAGRLTARRDVHIARSNPMLDVILLAVGLGFFALSVAYAFACDRL
jgi:hypothetical protein